MKINFSNQPVLHSNKSIFLAGPTLRDSSFEKSWRKEAVEILEKYGYDGVVYVPEYTLEEKFHDDMIEKQTRWEWEALDNSTVIMFWIPRTFPDKPAFTTNVEFGRYITKNSDNIILGYPNYAKKMEYIRLLYKELTNKNPAKTLEETIIQTLKLLNKEDI